MKKLFAMLLTAVLVMSCLAALAETAEPAGEAELRDGIDYGASELYAQEDMDAAIALIEAEFGTWEGCELYGIRYAGDECNSEENLNWLGGLKGDSSYAQCIEFLSDFHSPVEGGGAWEADADYSDYQWWLAREEGGEWELLTWGY